MDTEANSTPLPAGDNRWRCARCGIESAERTCFVIPPAHGKPPHDVRCVTCEQAWHASRIPLRFFTYQFVLWGPILLFVLRPSHWAIDAGLALVLVLLLNPLALLVHELGHLFTARLTGLEVGGLSIGLGRRLCSRELWGIPVVLNVWPLTARVFLGSRYAEALRARVWLTTLAGPLANAAMVWLSLRAWQMHFGTYSDATWVAWGYVNFVMGVSAMVPMQSNQPNTARYSDGWSLIRIWTRHFNPAVYAIAALSMRAVLRYEAGDYAGARRVSEEGLLRKPSNEGLGIMLAACHFQLKDYPAALRTLEPLQALADLAPSTRASIQVSNVLARLTLREGARRDDPEMAEIIRLSADAFAAFPCSLEFRSAHALVFLVCGEPLKALELMEYPLYESAKPSELGDRATVQFCAYQALNRDTEAQEALTLALRLNPSSVDLVGRMGLGCVEQATPASEELPVRG